MKMMVKRPLLSVMAVFETWPAYDVAFTSAPCTGFWSGSVMRPRMMSVDTWERAASGVTPVRPASKRARTATPMRECGMADLLRDRSGLLGGLGGLDLHALQREPAGAVAGLQVDDASPAESCDRP